MAKTPGITLAYDEVVTWVKSFDAYRSGRGGDRQRMLSVWSGQPLKVDRKSSDSIIVFDPAVSVAGGIQPDVLPELAEEAGRRDGFIERFLMSYPDAEPSGWTEARVTDDVSAGVLDAWRLLRSGRTGTVDLDPAAKELFVDWYNTNAAQIRTTHGLIQGVHAKLPVQLGRLALVLHCLAVPEDPAATPLATETMTAAIELVGYFVAHAHRALTAFGAVGADRPPLGPLATRVLNALEREGSTSTSGWVARSRLHGLLGGHVAADALAAALTELEQAGRAERRSTRDKENVPGRTREEWRAVPDGEDIRERNEQNEENRADGGESSFSSFRSQDESPRACHDCGQVLEDQAGCPDCDGDDDSDIHADGSSAMAGEETDDDGDDWVDL